MKKRVAGTVVGGAIIGALVAVIVMPRPPERGAAPDAAPSAAPPPAVAASKAVPVAHDDGFVDPCSQAAVQARLQHGWSLVRDDPMPLGLMERALRSFHNSMMTLPVDAARELGERQTRREAWLARVGDEPLLELVMELRHNGVGPVAELVGDAPRYAALFERAVPERPVPYRDFVAGKASATHGTTLQVPPGITRIGVWFPHGDVVPEDLSFVGAGMDRSLLVLDDPVLRHTALRMRVADCTLLVRGAFFQPGGDGASLTLDRVRVVGFDGSPDAHAMLDRGGPLALLARDSVFEGGLQPSPRPPSLLRALSPSLLARFERCDFRGVRFDVKQIHVEATVVLDGCRLLDLPVDVAAALERRDGLVLRDTTLALAAPEGPGRPQPGTLDRLFPGWRAER